MVGLSGNARCRHTTLTARVQSDQLIPLPRAAGRTASRSRPRRLAERESTMAEVFRPVYYVNPATGKCVPKSFPGAVKRKSKTWWIRYYTPDGVRHKAKGFRDKKATENRAAELERRGIRLDAGIVDPADEHGRRP